MKYDPNKHHRRSIRLKGYDYTQPGAYFFTLVTAGRECLFGEVVDGEMRLNGTGEIVAGYWQCLAVYFHQVRLDGFVAMPNHIHAIISIVDGRGEASADTRLDIPESLSADASPLRAKPAEPAVQTEPIGTQPGSLGAIIQNYKSVTARIIHKLPDMSGIPVWQRNYYEHIIRSEAELEKIGKYIKNNPEKWEEDQLNPYAAANKS